MKTSLSTAWYFVESSGVASPRIGGKPKNLGGAKIFHFRKNNTILLEKTLHKVQSDYKL